jgi:hypothetical protein
VAPAPTTGPLTAQTPSNATQGSQRPSLTTGMGGVTIRLDGPRSRVTEQPSAQVTGRVLLGTVPKLTLQVDDASRDLMLDGKTFQGTVALKPGVNVVRVIATDAEGRQSQDSVTIEYRPPLAAAKVSVTSPADGHTIGAADLPFVIMEGEIDDPRVTRVRLIANESRVVVPVVGRKFRQVIPVLEPSVRLRAELVDVSGAKPSPTITVSSQGTSQAGVLVVNWTDTPADARPEIVAVFRARADRPDTAEVPVRVEAAASRPGAPKDVYVIRKMHAGVYRLVMRDPSGATLSGVPVLHLGRTGPPLVLPLAPLTATPGGQIPLARILLPYAVLWEHDDWFSGKSESAETITKFRSPEGVTWTERKGGLAR